MYRVHLYGALNEGKMMKVEYINFEGHQIRDLTKETFPYCQALYPISNGNKYSKGTRWKFKCICGQEFEAKGRLVSSGDKKSCGCMKGIRSRTHGLSGTRLHRIWGAMKQRCGNPKNTRYKNYGGRGIKVCDEWLNSFQAFYDWALANGYRDGLTIDRIDNDKGYYPDNCRWATLHEQVDHRTTTKLVEYKGEIHTCREWGEILGIPIRIFENRLLKMSVEKAITTPYKPIKKRGGAG